MTIIWTCYWSISQRLLQQVWLFFKTNKLTMEAFHSVQTYPDKSKAFGYFSLLVNHKRIPPVTHYLPLLVNHKRIPPVPHYLPFTSYLPWNSLDWDYTPLCTFSGQIQEICKVSLVSVHLLMRSYKKFGQTDGQSDSYKLGLQGA